MLKLIYCVKRRPELTREEFDRHWIEHHAPLVRAQRELLGIRRYIQTCPIGQSRSPARTPGQPRNGGSRF
jgi:EthD domain